MYKSLSFGKCRKSYNHHSSSSQLCVSPGSLLLICLVGFHPIYKWINIQPKAQEEPYAYFWRYVFWLVLPSSALQPPHSNILSIPKLNSLSSQLRETDVHCLGYFSQHHGPESISKHRTGIRPISFVFLLSGVTILYYCFPTSENCHCIYFVNLLLFMVGRNLKC